MQIHELKVTKRKERKRIGRGGKTGTTAGRGSNGQKSRSGASVDPLFEGGRSTLLERMKKVRGFKSIHPKKHTVTLATLDRVLSSGDVVTRSLLVEKRIVDKKALLEGVKIVATGTLTKKLSLGADVLASEIAKKAFTA
ncbi:MAG: 50S ribosomal protein L15 [Candidatus Moranbacteria bacterium]|jgi:large subunit ribosomal protein L15|nr:50S ribosomal protein L15 [Candidatus Moranbacteria bacterium]